MHTCQVIAFILLAVAAVLATIEKTYVAALRLPTHHLTETTLVKMRDVDVTCPACDQVIAVPLSLSAATREGNNVNVVVSSDTTPLKLHLAHHVAQNSATLT